MDGSERSKTKFYAHNATTLWVTSFKFRINPSLNFIQSAVTDLRLRRWCENVKFTQNMQSCKNTVLKGK